MVIVGQYRRYHHAALSRRPQEEKTFIKKIDDLLAGKRADNSALMSADKIKEVIGEVKEAQESKIRLRSH